jgi:hypothetical protein
VAIGSGSCIYNFSFVWVLIAEEWFYSIHGDSCCLLPCLEVSSLSLSLSLSLSPSCLACMFVAMYQTKHKIYTRRSSCASIHALYMCHRIFCCNGNIEDSERKKMLKHKHHLEHSCYLQLFSCCKMLDFLAYKWWSECL